VKLHFFFQGENGAMISYIYLFTYLFSYTLEGPGIETRWGVFSISFQTDSGAHPASYRIGTDSLSRGQRARTWH
jgi:hypothetical protein